MSEDPDGRRLDSWKEIAEHLNRDVTTAHRWQERGLPVHRVPGGRRQAVFAYTAEIDRWLATGDSRTLANGQPLPEIPSTTPGKEPTPPQEETPTRGFSLSPARRWGAVALLGLVAAGAIGLGLRGASSASGPGGRLLRVEIEGDSLVAVGSDGSVRWRYKSPARLVVAAPHPLQSESRGWVGDLDGDGDDEALFSMPVSVGPNLGQDTLYCFSSDGRPLWQRQLADRWTFGGGTYGPPWLGGRVTVYKVDGQARIAWSQNHHTWWPSVLSVFDKDGERIGTFVHSGHIYALQVADTLSGPLVLAGGVSNALGGAVLAVLDGRNVSGASAESPGSPFACLDCPRGSPLRYLLFPRSELSTAAGSPYNKLVRIRVMDEGFDLQTVEEHENPDLAEVFFVGRDFSLQRAAFSDGWAPAHRLRESEGKLDHPVDRCPQPHPPAARVWTPGAGWSDFAPSREVRLSGNARR